MDLYRSIVDHLDQGHAIALARIIRQEGSSPRQVGAACIVLEDGELLGTVGGGSLECRVHQIANEVLETKKSNLLRFTMQGEDVDDSQMLCGGEVSIYIEPLSPENPETLAIYNHIIKTRQAGINGHLITVVAPGTLATDIEQRLVITENGEIIGGLDFKPDFFDTKCYTDPELIRATSSENHDLFIEHFGSPQTVIIFGCGHISTCLAPLLKPLGFSVIVVDDRSDFANARRFPDAEQIHVVPFSESFARLNLTASSYIVIVTRGHAYDKEVLAESLRHSVAYIGMIGSHRKRNAIFRALLAEGATEEQLQSIHSPIGIDILSETPEEIAISIAAELIRARAERRIAIL